MAPSAQAPRDLNAPRRVWHELSRRRWLAAAGAAAIALSPARARPQARRTPRIGVLIHGTPVNEPQVALLRRGLRELGHVEGDNIALEYRYAAGQAERLPHLAAELARLQPDAIVALGSDVAPAARQATATIPIVVVASADPVATGLVASLARPGGNVTGVTFAAPELGARRLSFLREAAPRASRLAVLWDPDHRDGELAQAQRPAGRSPCP